MRKKPAISERCNEWALENLANEILGEIFKFLYPCDLLQLARTRKRTRSKLLTKSSQPWWKQARVNAEIPCGIRGMSEPALAHLLYDNFCSSCGEKCKQINFTGIQAFGGLKRWCNECIKELFSPAPPSIAEAALALMPKINAETQQKAAAVNSQVDKFMYLSAAIAYSNAMSEHELNSWLSKMQPEHRQEIEDAQNICNWHMANERKSAMAKYSMQADRLAAIISRLRLQGWGAEIDWMERWTSTTSGRHMPNLRKIRSVWQAKPLTERRE
ncbi:hypothetical protein VNI00_018313 [Paramarasmius palmivorus]|uniref:F-box domain-containing protein n=1 Tax=Paramarasmius palmivorus TaxID=297713 RepID=A0AAW0AZ09_9AGAR